MTDLTMKLRRNADLQIYLSQLAELVGRQIVEGELSSIEEVNRLKEGGFRSCPEKTISLMPENLREGRFHSFIKRLAIKNPVPVAIFLKPTQYCGTFYATRIDKINFDFRFDLIPEGIFTLITEDGGDEFVLDFDADEIEVGLQGEMWGSVDY